ncbi:endonuclease/exonuclease/phosphatase family protein [Saccharibacillus alkalitolerans]|uniref:Endonuclease/exonuclease/phosphatase family protein n=1 Tax=Saccharibacillus alkalitolerans TaxID=2705290 RepID=A0ABX0FCF1_9BACL|nr:endonuclease/exonuclease/phosphatase family protein [Saccharibacillus alkalitolerans]NGZ77253.1 endonuclease/exonuclease/phosphatase family protein [Saccharibacillus alkalitolerans]
MKLLTLNAHAWHEEEQEQKISRLADFINERGFDLIALQEINQSPKAEEAGADRLSRYFEAEPGVKIRIDNYALVLLEQLDAPYYWSWLPTHSAYQGRYDEGVAVLTREPIEDAVYDYISGIRDYMNPKTRRLLGVKTSSRAEGSSEAEPLWLFSAHCGWWNDEAEPFRGQWDRAEALMKPLRDAGERIFLLGDLNNVAQIRGEGYDYVMDHGWCDLYTAAAEKDEGSTVLKAIAGWSDNESPLRIDYILSGLPVEAKKSEVVLDGNNGPVVSDHFGVAAEI